MTKFYDNEIIPTQKINGFFSSAEVEEIKDAFIETEELILELSDKPQYNSVQELYFGYNDTKGFLVNHGLLKNRETKAQEHYIRSDTHLNIREKISNLFLNDILYETREKLRTHFKDGYIERFGFMNMTTDFQVHCDSIDVKNRFLARPDNMDDLKSDDYLDPLTDNYQIYQGLINIDAPSDHGTLIFDQWFPYSTYLTPEQTTDNKDRWAAKKDIIFFYGDDKPERFNEHIRNYTNKPLSNADCDTIYQSCIKKDRFIKEEYFGLSLESVLTFDEPGTVSMWDSKKYHKTIPFLIRDYQSRLVLQFVGMKKSNFYTSKAGNTMY